MSRAVCMYTSQGEYRCANPSSQQQQKQQLQQTVPGGDRGVDPTMSRIARNAALLEGFTKNAPPPAAKNERKDAPEEPVGISSRFANQFMEIADWK